MSDAGSLKVIRLQVRRMPGISDPFTIDGLQAGVNVIHGPNGSGKTTTARALEAAIWPKLEKGRKSVAAHFCIDATNYTVDLDAGRVAIQANAKDGDLPALPEPEFRERYWLSLHELLLAADAGDKFASEVERQSSGGYDLAAARDDLGFRGKPSAATKESADLNSARARLREAQSAQAAIHEEAKKLAELERRCDESAPATSKKEVLDVAIQHSRARAKHLHATERCAAFSPLHESINGTEHSTLLDLTERAEKAATKEKSEAAQVAQADADAREAFPDAGPGAELMTAFREDIRALELAEQARAAARNAVASAAAGLEEARRVLGLNVTDDQLAQIDASVIGDFTTVASQAEKQAADIAAAKAEVSRAGNATAPSDLDAVRSGIDTLTRWLTDAQPQGDSEADRSQRKLMLVASIVAGVISICLAYWSRGSLVGVVVAGVLLLLSRRAKQPAEEGARPQRQSDYARLGLAIPAAWTPESVIVSLDGLCRRLGEGRVAEERAAWGMEAGRRVQDLEARNQGVEQQRMQLASRCGVAPDADSRRLLWLVERIGRWQSAKAEYAKAAASFVDCEKQLKELCERICGRLSPFGNESISSASDAKGCAEALEARIQKYELAIKTRADARARVEEARQECAELGAKINLLLRPGSGDVIDAAQLKRLCDDHAGYVEACRARSFVEEELQTTHSVLTRHAYFTDDLLTVPESELELRRAEQERLLEGYVGLVKEAEGLRTRVEQAKRAGDVERALAEVATAEAALEAMREKDLGAMVGDALIRHLQDVARNQHRPTVFRRAREIFSTITRGRYLLDFQDSGVAGEASFRAIDQITKVGHAIGELSSATRVQLLLAVRIAFVESQEQGIRLPLFLDETLGTSDDIRAHAIIDAIFTLAEGGRQVFYFTAQRDEVAKWTSVAKAREVDVNVVDLTVVRSLADAGDVDTLFANLPDTIGPLVPSPEGKTREEYAELLNVPPISVNSGGAGSAHLWYLVDDLNVLYEFLAYRLTTWGQLSTMLANGGLGLAAKHDQVIARAAALARVLDTLLEQLAIGRGRLVNRAVLLGSGAISNLKIDEVAALAEEHHGNARELIEALETKAVPGFQARKTVELRDYLEREGYLDEQAPRSSEEICRTVLTSAANDIHAGALNHADIDGLLNALRRGGANRVGESLSIQTALGNLPALPSQETVLPA